MTQEFGKEKLLQRVHADQCQIASIAKWMYEKYGDEPLDIIRENNFKDRVKTFTAVAKQMGIPIGEGGLEDWLKMQKMLGEAGLLVMEQFSEPDRAVNRTTWCPLAQACKDIFPDYCRKIAIGTERAMAYVVNPDLEVHVDCYIPEGATHCDVVCQWKPGKKPRAKAATKR